jgi:hypothetical protein
VTVTGTPDFDLVVPFDTFLKPEGRVHVALKPSAALKCKYSLCQT